MKTFLLSLFCFYLFAAAPSARADESIKEVGLNLGTPAALNLAVGYWGTETLPVLLRASGMYYGSGLKGLQGELGWALDQEGPFRQYIALALISLHIENRQDLEILDYTGAGPVYGFNLYGFSLQGGITFGSGKKSAPLLPDTNIPASLIVQLGYSVLF